MTEETTRITAIEPQKRHKGRVNIFVNGAFAVGLAEGVAVTLGLKVGQQITPERLREAAYAEERFQAREAAYRLLAFRARSEQEITERLRQKGYDAPLITETVAYFREAGLLNDEAFAAAWVASRGRTRGPQALNRELRLKGVAAETVTDVLEERHDPAQEQETALQLAYKRVGRPPKESGREAQARLVAYLQRRGFGWETIRPVLREVFTSGAQETDEEGNPIP